MKKRFLCMTVMMVVLLGFGAISWAGEASVFDSDQGIIIRVFTTGTAPNISAYLEARDTEGVKFSGDPLDYPHVEVTHVNGPSAPITAEADDTFLVHGPSDPLTTSDVSMSFDIQTGLVYVFCTDVGEGLHMMKFRVALAGAPAVDGVCGTTSNNSCTSGSLNDIADSGTNYLWQCLGQNGGSDALNCSLPKPVNGACGTTVNTCTSGTFSDTTDTSTEYKWACNGLNGGTPASCSSPIDTGSGLPDFAKPSVSGMASSYELGYTYNVSVTVRNEGTAPAGPSTLKVYQNTTSTPGGALLYEQAVGALAPGQSTSISFVLSPRSTCSIHVYCKFIFVADANNVVVESDESDNIYVKSMLRAR